MIKNICRIREYSSDVAHFITRCAKNVYTSDRTDGKVPKEKGNLSSHMRLVILQSPATPARAKSFKLIEAHVHEFCILETLSHLEDGTKYYFSIRIQCRWF